MENNRIEGYNRSWMNTAGEQHDGDTEECGIMSLSQGEVMNFKTLTFTEVLYCS